MVFEMCSKIFLSSPVTIIIKILNRKEFHRSEQIIFYIECQENEEIDHVASLILQFGEPVISNIRILPL